MSERLVRLGNPNRDRNTKLEVHSVARQVHKNQEIISKYIISNDPIDEKVSHLQTNQELTMRCLW